MQDHSENIGFHRWGDGFSNPTRACLHSLVFIHVKVSGCMCIEDTPKAMCKRTCQPPVCNKDWKYIDSKWDALLASFFSLRGCIFPKMISLVLNL